MNEQYLSNTIKLFEYYKTLGEKTIDQLKEENLFWQYNENSNSIAIIVKHLWGNMLSRWTNFLTTDGEKEWRKRDEEFENNFTSKNELLEKWNEGWQCLLSTLKNLSVNDLDKTVYIRNQGHLVTDAINRQLAHYASHIGQIIFIGKMIKNNEWQTLSIPKGSSAKFNQEKFAQPKHNEHFTDETLQKNKS
ncbi:MAG: DUF1572 domain-containing protein [Chitinophagales bacterium]|nr:DUF1572 domain-containing protein [Chitinophagales bacterium]